MMTAYVCEGVRTPIGRYGGALSMVRTDDLAAHPLTVLRQRFPIADWESIDEVILGCVNQAGEDNRNVARMASLLAGIPHSVPAMTVNRLCASGMEAVAVASRAIATGEISLAIAGGVESMSRSPFVMPKAASAFSRTAELYDTTLGWRFINPKMQEQYGTDSMAETGENVAFAHGVDRESQDKFALGSQQKAAAAKKAGFFAEEIVPVNIPGPKGSVKAVCEDEHIRPDTSLEALAKLPTPFRKGGTVTAGNASGINDGACAMFVASEAAAAKFGLTPVARILGSSSAGVEPRVMGVGPIPAIQKLLDRLKMQIADFDTIELNEAFAAQALAVTRAFGLPDDYEKVNPNGGAIALGHPLGMSGARLVLTAAHQLQRIKARYALASMCVGVGQGMAIALERV
ncbi:MAG: 3-oxoadipyl-CoA thiolase [Bryobacterales bacterium]|nr:3-oxoadipyl-CoA thiolase [Bryobacterales bacterium]MBV9396764.1 3-oxoadipyl-CoA thiolase [Bryobacterales bacterium]